MANRKNQNKAKLEQGSRDIGKDKEGNPTLDTRQKESYQEDNEENDSGLQKAALLSALNIETRKRHGEEVFDEDAGDEEDDMDDDDDDD